MRFKPKPNPLRSAIKKAVIQRMDEDARAGLKPFVNRLDEYTSQSTREWLDNLPWGDVMDDLNIGSFVADAAEKNAGQPISCELYKTWFGSSLVVWLKESQKDIDKYAPFDRLDLHDVSVMEASIYCRLARVDAGISDNPLVLAEPNKFWNYHPERMRCSRLHLRRLLALGARIDPMENAMQDLFNQYLKWTRSRRDNTAHCMFHMMNDFALEDAYVSYVTEGKKIFSLDPALCEMLRSSDIDEIPYDALRLPQDAFYIHFGAQEDILDTNNRPLEGAYVYRNEKGVITFFFVFEDFLQDDVMDWINGRDVYIELTLPETTNIGASINAGLAAQNQVLQEAIEKSGIRILPLIRGC
jgi:hypothetical protein